MDSTVFKYNQHHYRQQNQHFARTRRNNSSNNNNSNIITSHNHKNQNSIFILNTANNNILPNNTEFYYSDLNDNNVVSLPSSSPSAPSTTTTTTTTSSVWSSASSTMCSPAAHAIQKLFFNCSSNSFKLNQGNYSGIESKTFKSKSEILKKKAKFWKYLEGEAHDKNHQPGIESEEKMPTKSFKYKSKYWSKSCESDNQNQQDLSELLEFSCSLCDNCRCVDCQIGYFDCESSDDSNSEYSFHLSAYEEEEDENADDNDNYNENETERVMELKTSKDTHNCCSVIDSQQYTVRKLEMDSQLVPKCALAYCACSGLNCNKAECCQKCFAASIVGDGEGEGETNTIN